MVGANEATDDADTSNSCSRRVPERNTSGEDSIWRPERARDGDQASDDPDGGEGFKIRSPTTVLTSSKFWQPRGLEECAPPKGQTSETSDDNVLSFEYCRGHGRKIRRGRPRRRRNVRFVRPTNCGGCSRRRLRRTEARKVSFAGCGPMKMRMRHEPHLLGRDDVHLLVGGTSDFWAAGNRDTGEVPGSRRCVVDQPFSTWRSNGWWKRQHQGSGKSTNKD